MLSTSTEYSLSYDSTPKLIHDSSALSIAIILYGGNSYISQDDLATLERFELVGVSGEITSAAFTSTTLCLLVDGEIYTLPYSDFQIISPTVMEPVGDRHLAGRSIHMAGETYDIIVLWSKLSSVILVSEDGGKSFTSLTLPYTPGTVHSVNIHPFKRIISVLTSTSHSLVYIIDC
jgi:hypothetical protein